MRPILGCVMFVILLIRIVVCRQGRSRYCVCQGARPPTLGGLGGVAKKRSDKIKMQCAADYVSDDGGIAVSLAEVERYLAGTRIREYKQGEIKALRVSRDVVVLS